MEINTSNSIKAYNAIVLRSALKLYMKTGIKANRDYTPKNMMKTAERLTGKTFKPRAYQAAVDALTAMVEGQ